MTYANGRRILDCDAHLMEPPGWLESFAPQSIRDALPPMNMGDPGFESIIAASVDRRRHRQDDSDERTTAERDLMTMERKGWGALGDNDGAERSRALDLLGFELQIVFPTGSFPQVAMSPTHIQVEAAEAMNRGMGVFCQADERLHAVGYVPFHYGPEVAIRVLHQALRDGCDVVMVDSIPARDSVAPTHADFDPLWEAIEHADVPVMLHIGLDNGWRPIRPSFFNNGRTLDHFRSDAPGDALSFLSVGFPAQLFIGSMILDGVFDRHPNLRFGVAELAASWVPGFLHFIDTSARSFSRLQDLSHLHMKPSEYVRKHFCFSPFAGEDVGFMIETAGPELFMFSSDYPHHEGTADPLGKCERTMAAVTDGDKELFYVTNTLRLLGLPTTTIAPTAAIEI